MSMLGEKTFAHLSFKFHMAEKRIHRTFEIIHLDGMEHPGGHQRPSKAILQKKVWDLKYFSTTYHYTYNILNIF